MLTCGCGNKAVYEVYEDKQPHCLDCMLDAVECRNWIPVRRIDEFDSVAITRTKTTKKIT